MLRAVTAYLVAVAATYVLAAAAQTQHVVGQLQAMGLEVPLTDRLDATLHDIAGMATTFLPLIAIGFAIALPVAGLIARWLPGWRAIGYPLAGGVAVLALHLLLAQVLNIHPVAAARSTAGLALQALAGVLGGYVFLRLLPARVVRSARW